MSRARSAVGRVLGLRRRAILYALLALAAPIPAFALTGGGGAAHLGLAVSFNGCGLQDGHMVCSAAASFDRLGAGEYYTAKVTKPDGSVQDYGTVAEGSEGGRTTIDLAFAYAGGGAYTVAVAAWGHGTEGDRELIEEETGEAGDGEDAGAEESEPEDPGEEVGDGAGGAESGAGAEPEDGEESQTAPEDADGEQAPPCEPEEPPALEAEAQDAGEQAPETEPAAECPPVEAPAAGSDGGAPEPAGEADAAEPVPQPAP